MARWKAPLHTTRIMLSSGPVSVDEDGGIDAPDELTEGDIAGLSASGFEPEVAKARKAESKPADPKPAKPKEPPAPPAVTQPPAEPTGEGKPE